jgi:hypothetical protein
MDGGFCEGFRETVQDIPSTNGRGQFGMMREKRGGEMGMEELMGRFWEKMPMSA